MGNWEKLQGNLGELQEDPGRYFTVRYYVFSPNIKWSFEPDHLNRPTEVESNINTKYTKNHRQTLCGVKDI
jgi:hypothetical protein